MKKVLSALMFFLLATVFCASAAFADSKPISLTLGHIVKPDGPVAIAAVRFASLVEERTAGGLIIQVYDSGTLGSQRDLLEGLQIGTIDMTISSPAIMSALTPKVSIFDLPYIFKNAEHAYRVLDGEIGTAIFAEGEDFGYLCVSVWENGFRHTTNNKRVVRTPKDFKGLKIRVPESKVYLEMIKALGANPTPMAFGDLFSALQNGTVDGQENPISQSYSSRFHEVQKHMTLDGHIYACNPLLISNTAKARISADLYAILVNTANEIRDWQRSLVAESETEMMEKMAASGMEITALSDAEKTAFSEAVAPVWEMFENIIGKELIEQVAGN